MGRVRPRLRMKDRTDLITIIFSDTKDDEPVLLDVPPAVAWGKFLPTILDAWRAKVGHPRVTGGREELALHFIDP